MNPEQYDTYLALSSKRMVLIAYIQRLLSLKLTETGQEILIDTEIGRADLELKLVEAMLSAISNNAPMTFPSVDALQAVRTSMAKLQQGIDASAKLGDLVTAAGAVIDTWPKING